MHDWRLPLSNTALPPTQAPALSLEFASKELSSTELRFRKECVRCSTGLLWQDRDAGFLDSGGASTVGDSVVLELFLDFERVETGDVAQAPCASFRA